MDDSISRTLSQLEQVVSRMTMSSIDSTTKTPFKLSNTSIDEYRPIKVVVVGAGFGGILAGIRFRQRVSNLDLTIYEKNAGVGGTWYSNTYPGAACDIPAHCYQYSFTQKTDWSSFYASSPEIRSYLEDVVDEWKLMRYIKLQHELTHARYDEESGKWLLRIRRPIPTSTSPDQIQFDEFDDTADVLFTCLGPLSRWSWPAIDGLDTFKGQLVHSAEWDVNHAPWQETVKGWGDTKVGVIGVGSSAIQIVPALQPHVAKIYNYVRGKAWIAPPFFASRFCELMDRDMSAENFMFSDDDKKRFTDPAYFKEFRHEIEIAFNSQHALTSKDSEMQKDARATFKKHMVQQLAKKPWIADHVIPDFPVACRRLTQGLGYLDVLCDDNVDFVPTHIKQVTPTGIELVDGQNHDLDVLVCATGFDTTFKLPFPVIGRKGVNVDDKWSPHPTTYLSICADGFPNWFFCMGPNSGIGTGSVLVIIEHQVDYVVAATLKLQRECLKSMDVKQDAVADFDEYLEHYFRTAVFGENCRSWYKVGKTEGRVVGLWPGSCLHVSRALEHPRWEDYNYEYLDGISNRMHWLGDGQTLSEKTGEGDNAWYLNDDQVDVPPVPST